VEECFFLLQQQKEELDAFVQRNSVMAERIFSNTMVAYQRLCENIERNNGVRKTSQSNTNNAHYKLNNNNNNNNNNYNNNNSNNKTNTQDNKSTQMKKRIIPPRRDKKSASLERADFLQEKENRRKAKERTIKAATTIQQAYKKHLFRKRLEVHIAKKQRERAVLVIQRVARGFLSRKEFQEQKPNLIRNQLAKVFHRGQLLRHAFNNWRNFTSLIMKRRLKWESRMNNLRKCWGKTSIKIFQHFRNPFPATRIAREGGKYAMAAAYHNWYLQGVYLLKWQEHMSVL